MRALHSIKLFGVSNMECENKYDGACLQIYVEPWASFQTSATITLIKGLCVQEFSNL